MGRLWTLRAWPLLLALAGGLAQAASIGTFGGPHIRGKISPGDFAAMQRDLAGETFEKPLKLRIDPASNELELLQIGRWLRERRPVLQFSGDCVLGCARYLLPAGRAILLAKGAFVAFSSFNDWPLALKQDLDEGRLFNDTPASQASRERLLARLAPAFERSTALQQARQQGPDLPAPALAFLDGLTRPSMSTNLSFEADNFRSSMRVNCSYGIPDAEGLRQLGLDIPGYQPPSAELAAKRLKTSAFLIYIGPLLDPLPEQPLCKAPINAAPTSDAERPAS